MKKNILKQLILIFSPLMVAMFTSFTFQKEYGVFLGLNSNNAIDLSSYKVIVLEGEEFDENHIKSFHQQGQRVFAYLNIGALEKYRSYYKEYKKFALDVYHDWPDEKWIDVSKEKWQSFIIKNKANEYYKKGFDGFFIDNTDVYYQYQKKEIYEGLISILKGLRQYNMEILINGGDIFVKKLIKDKILDIFDGVNQECVFTSINFKHNTYGKQSQKESKYFLEYLTQVKKQNKKVYLLEYGADVFTEKKIIDYCKIHQFKYFISSDKSLTKENIIH
ncbi:MAG: endo alpha-1,4 polygalactosaminidase [Treponema sp.]